MKRFRIFLHETLIAVGVTVSLQLPSPLRSFVEKGARFYYKTILSQYNVVSEVEKDRRKPAAFLRRRNHLKVCVR